MVDKLIEAFSSPETCGDVCDVNWLIMPLLNPDGYEYSRTTDRMWRKNRSKPKDRNDSCGTKKLFREINFLYFAKDPRPPAAASI